MGSMAKSGYCVNCNTFGKLLESRLCHGCKESWRPVRVLSHPFPAPPLLLKCARCQKRSILSSGSLLCDSCNERAFFESKTSGYQPYVSERQKAGQHLHAQLDKLELQWAKRNIEMLTTKSLECARLKEVAEDMKIAWIDYSRRLKESMEPSSTSEGEDRMADLERLGPVPLVRSETFYSLPTDPVSAFEDSNTDHLEKVHDLFASSKPKTEES